MAKDLSPRSHFGLRFSLLARRWRQVLEVHLAAAGLSDATWIPLVHLQNTGGGITQKELAALVGIDGSSLVRLIDILCREGLVERRVDESDGRARLIHLTAAGEQRIVEIRQALTKGEEAMLAGISDTDIATMLQHFGKIEERLVELQEKRPRGARRRS